MEIATPLFLLTPVISRSEYAYTFGELGEPLDTVVYGYDDADWGDLLTSYDGKTITYDQIGNPLRDGTWRYGWEHGRQLASMFDGKNTVWNYTYDASGMRTSRTDGTTTYSYVYNGGLLSKMTVGDNVLEFAYDASGTPMTVTYNGTIYYYLTNIQGDVVSIVDADGVLLVHYVYDAWGNLLATEGTMDDTLGVINPLRYRGYVYDTETELYYLQSRYYNPEIGRFINADNYIATGQGFVGNNMFAYCLNNPVNMSDSMGCWAEWATSMTDPVTETEAGYYYTKTASGKSNIPKSSSNSLPRTGAPNSSQTLRNPDGSVKQKRWYDQNGNAERDRDYNHAGKDIPFPHDHVWKDGKREQSHLDPSPDYQFSADPLVGVLVVSVCTLGVIALTVDDLTIIGAADNFLVVPLLAAIGGGIAMISE